ncbi:hypothetical protein VTK56DRAFT_2302 [Thermocarpiscus australiensis]
MHDTRSFRKAYFIKVHCVYRDDRIFLLQLGSEMKCQSLWAVSFGRLEVEPRSCSTIHTNSLISDRVVPIKREATAMCCSGAPQHPSLR